MRRVLALLVIVASVAGLVQASAALLSVDAGTLQVFSVPVSIDLPPPDISCEDDDEWHKRDGGSEWGREDDRDDRDHGDCDDDCRGDNRDGTYDLNSLQRDRGGDCDDDCRDRDGQTSDFSAESRRGDDDCDDGGWGRGDRRLTDPALSLLEATPLLGIAGPEPTATQSPEPTPTEATPKPTETASPEPTKAPEPTPTETPDPTSTVEATSTPTLEATPTLGPSPSAEATATEEPSATPEPTLEPSPTPTEEPTATPTSAPEVTSTAADGV
ncbi:MAG: hypothetical protein R3C39_10090 [Dehalococcoidia bacterium]